MKTVIIYSSLTGNTKQVCERAFEILEGEKELLAIEDWKTISWEDVENVIVGYWVDKGTADSKARKFISQLKHKNLYFIGTLGAAPDSFHGNKCFKNVSALCGKENHFQGGVLIRGKVAEELKKKMNTFPLSMIHKVVPAMKQTILEADGHPNEEDFQQVVDFIRNLVNPKL